MLVIGDYEVFPPKVMNGTVAKNMRQIQGSIPGWPLLVRANRQPRLSSSPLRLGKKNHG